jgi:lysophospholipase L1-like esterase
MILMPAARALNAICCRPAIMYSAVTPPRASPITQIIGAEHDDDVRDARLRQHVAIEAPQARETHRVAVNAWIRESGAFDGVADFDAASRDPEMPTQMRAVDDCGDGAHPSEAGYCKMGDAIDLALFA